MVASSFALMKERGAFAGSPSTAYVYAVASLAYEMLGGVKAGGSMDAYVPIPGLSEQGNAVLRRALTPEQHYKSARAFVEDLAGRGLLRAPAGSGSRADLCTASLADRKNRGRFR